MMTRKEILAMETGKELDKLIATEVMGWSQVRITTCIAKGDYHREPCWTDTKQVDPFGWGRPEGLCIPQNNWEPSTDISSAYRVMTAEGSWDIKKRFRPHPDDPAGSGGRATYQATVFLSGYDPYEDELINKRTGKSPWCWQLPEAICKAALLAKCNK